MVVEEALDAYEYMYAESAPLVLLEESSEFDLAALVPTRSRVDRSAKAATEAATAAAQATAKAATAAAQAIAQRAAEAKEACCQIL